MGVTSTWALVGCALGVLNLCSISSGFAHLQPSSALIPAHGRRDRGTALRLVPLKEQQGKDDTAASSASVSEFEQTSGPVKAFVGGLTDFFVLFSGGENKEEALAPAAPKVREYEMRSVTLL